MDRRILYNQTLTRIEVAFPFDWELKDFVKAIPGSRFDGAAKVWHFPKSAAATVVKQLEPRQFVADDAVIELLEKQESSEEPRGLRISEVNASATRALREKFPTSIWIIGQISDFRSASANGHAYFQLVETDDNDQPIAAIQAVAFRDTFRRVAKCLADEELDFESGLEVAVLADVSIYARSGTYQLVVQDIDATWSRRQLAEKREKILKQLRDEGIDRLNIERPMPDAPQRVALLTAHESEAYHDFVTTLSQSGFSFDITFFDVRVQGDGLEDSVLQALALVRANASRFDVCVICRGGGSRTELGSWDNLAVARAVAQLPLKIVVGIGHQRDVSVLDDIAESTKTPTAAAELLVEKLSVIWLRLISSTERLPHRAQQALRLATSNLDRLASRLRLRAQQTFGAEQQRLRAEVPMRLRNASLRAIDRSNHQLERFGTMVRPSALRRLLRNERERLDARVAYLDEATDRVRARQIEALEQSTGRLHERSQRRLRAESDRLQSLHRAVRASDPIHVLRRGFAIVRDDEGSVVRSASAARVAQSLTIQFHQGRMRVTPDDREEEFDE